MRAAMNDLQVRLASPFLLCSVEPPLGAVAGRQVRGFQRIVKRIAFELEDQLFLVVQLMVAGRFHWKAAGANIPGKVGLAAFDFPEATLLLTEASSKKRTSLHCVHGVDSLSTFNCGGIEVLQASLDTFRSMLLSENHTLKRALTDPSLFSGIDNASAHKIRRWCSSAAHLGRD